MQFTYGITYVRTGNTAKIYVYYNNSCNVLQVGLPVGKPEMI